MFNVNLINKPGVQRNDRSILKPTSRPEIVKQNDLEDQESINDKENERNNTYFFTLILVIFIILMIGLLYFKGQISFINDIFDKIIMLINKFFNR